MSPDYRAALLLTARELPPGAAVPVVREALMELLSGSGGPPDAPAPDFTIAQVAARFGRAPSTIRGWVAARHLTGAYHFRGRELRIPAAAVLAFEVEQRGPAGIPADNAPRRTHRAPDLSGWRKVAS